MRPSGRGWANSRVQTTLRDIVLAEVKASCATPHRTAPPSDQVEYKHRGFSAAGSGQALAAQFVGQAGRTLERLRGRERAALSRTLRYPARRFSIPGRTAECQPACSCPGTSSSRYPRMVAVRACLALRGVPCPSQEVPAMWSSTSGVARGLAHQGCTVIARTNTAGFSMPETKSMAAMVFAGCGFSQVSR